MPKPRTDEHLDAAPPAEQLPLVDVPAIHAPNRLVDPDQIRLRAIPSRQMVNMQRALSRAPWKPRFRNLAYLLELGGDPVALICLSSPVINRISCRDQYLGLPADGAERGRALRRYADLSVCVGLQPLSWHWNIGKLAALVATTVGDDWTAAYGDELRGIVTTSLYGRGAQYNRIYRFLGYTQGRGTSHIPDYVWENMRRRLRAAGKLPTSGTNSRKKMVDAYSKEFGTLVETRQGERRAVYYHPAQPPELREQIVRGWYDRWGLPRYERTRDLEPPYQDGRTPAAATPV